MKKNLVHTSRNEEAVSVGVITRNTSRTQAREYLAELGRLADTAGANVTHTLVQERDRVDPATFLGKGKVRELAELVTEKELDLVIFDDDLSPVQVRNLEKHIKCKIIDRSGLILDIFASRAKSKEAMTQVELAQLQYMLPRLTRQWTHLSKQFGGIGTKGPGETQIEVDRRAIRKRIGLLKEKLQDISKEREVQRKRRGEFPRIALVGYTNAGKSTLLRAFSNADVLVEDRLFATLDTTVRSVHLTQAKKILLSDTVGFIRKLPPQLVASFRSTLAEVVESDLLLHVIDISHPQFIEHIEVVRSTLDEIQAAGKPTIHVFNKIDKLDDRSVIAALAKTYHPAVFISAERKINLTGLIAMIGETIDEGAVEETLTFSQADYKSVIRLREFAEIVKEEYYDNEVIVHCRITRKNADRLKKLMGSSRNIRRKGESPGKKRARGGRGVDTA